MAVLPIRTYPDGVLRRKAQPVERIDDRRRVRAGRLRPGAGPDGVQCRVRDDPFDFEVRAPLAQRLQPLLVAAKLGELRRLGRDARRIFMPALFAAHRMEGPAPGTACRDHGPSSRTAPPSSAPTGSPGTRTRIHASGAPFPA